MKTSTRMALALLIAAPLQAAHPGVPSSANSPHGAADPRHAAAFKEHLDALVPRLLAATGVHGAAVGLVRNGEVVFVEGWGEARMETGTPVGRRTLFNVGSVAKPVTAWGVMRLVEEGLVDLDAPISRYVSGWTPAPGPFDPAGITVRRLLSHTAGLSMASVPSAPEHATVPIGDALGDPATPVDLMAEPGTSWAYSGGGFMVLQLLIEEVSGRPFADFMREEVLEPMGLRDSSFRYSDDPARSGMATPYAGGEPAPRLAWPGAAAAGLYATPLDLAHFVAGSLSGESVLAPASIRRMTTPAPATDRPYTTRYGLGHDLWPLPDGRYASGHNGQNSGWSAAAWWIPGTGDGIVILTNDSQGMGVHRWVLCDWVAWAVGSAFGGYCSGRSGAPAGTLATAAPGEAVGGTTWWDGTVGTEEPGGVLVVRRWGREVLADARGVADLATKTPIGAATPFYVASVAKPVTAALVGRLSDRGLIDQNRPLGPEFPHLSGLADVTARHLLDQTAGVPDYFQWISWPRFRRLDDQGVVDSLAAHPWSADAAGERFAYSNSHYVLLSELVRRTTGVPLGVLFLEEYAAPLGLASAYVDGGDDPLPPAVAEGYEPDEEGFRLSSYERFDLPGPAPIVTLQWATTGAGGLFMSARDLARWGEHVAGTLAVRAPRSIPPFDSAYAGPRIGSVLGYSGGWFLSRLGEDLVYWHSGNRGGYNAVLAVVPAHGLTIAFLANRSDLVPSAIVEKELVARLGGS